MSDLSSRNSIANDEKESSSDHGRTYEKLLFTLLAKRGYDLAREGKFIQDQEFYIGKQLKMAPDVKFDDIVLGYKDMDDEKNLVFVKAKRKMKENHEINYDILSAEEWEANTTDKEDFNLQKYFVSFLRIREQMNTIEKFKGAKIKYVAIYTNIRLKEEELIVKSNLNDDALNNIVSLFTFENSILNPRNDAFCYQLKEVDEKIRKIFKSSSDLLRIARELAQYAVWPEHSKSIILGINETAVKLYQIALLREEVMEKEKLEDGTEQVKVLAIKKTNRDITERYCIAKFKKEFLDNESGSKKELRDEIFKSMRKYDKFEKENDDEQLKEILREVKFKVTPNFGKIDLHPIATELAQYAVWGSHREKNILGGKETDSKFYQVVIGNEVIEKSPEVLITGDEKYCIAEFRKNEFLDNCTSKSNQKLRDEIFKGMRKYGSLGQDVNDDDLKNILRDVKLKVTPNFGEIESEKTILPSEWKNVTDGDIDDFLKCFIFFVNQPNVTDLTIYISERDVIFLETELGRVLSNVLPKLKDRIEKELEFYFKYSHEEKWLSFLQLEQYATEQQEAINVFLMTMIYEDKVMKYGKFKEDANLGKLADSLDSFLDFENHKEMAISRNSALEQYKKIEIGKKILCVSSEKTQLSSIKILQYLAKKDYRKNNCLIFTKLSNLKYEVIRDRVEKAFRSEIFNLLIIECRNTIDEQSAEYITCKFSQIIKERPNKQIILITKHDESNILTKQFQHEFKKIYHHFDLEKIYINETDDINLKDFKPNENPFDKRVIVFQKQKEKISLAILTGFQKWNNYLDYLSQDKNLNKTIITDIMMKILNNKEIEIGNKPLGTSSLEGAYASLYEEINIDTLKDELVGKDQFEDDGIDKLFEEENSVASLQNQENSDHEIYIFEGIKGSDTRERKQKLIECLGALENVGESLEESMENHWKNVENHFGDVGSDSKIQIAKDNFNDKEFKKICSNYQNRKMFWISIEDKKFKLQQFYNPNFYLERRFVKVIIQINVKEMLMKEKLSDIFIFSYVDELKFEKLLGLQNECGESKYKANKLKLRFYENSAESEFQKLFEQKSFVHLLRLRENKFIWCKSHGSLDTLNKYIEHEKVITPLKVKEMLSERDLSDVFIFSCVNEEAKLDELLGLEGEDEKREFKANKENIKLHSSENSAENEFQKLSKQNQCAVYLLRLEENQFILCKSHDSLDTSRESITQNRYSSVNEDILFKEIRDKKVVIFADDPGMGKSSTVTKLYESPNTQTNSHWVMRINLREHLQAVRDIELTSDNINRNLTSAVDFLLEVEFNLNHTKISSICNIDFSLTKNLLKLALEKTTSFRKPLFLIFDGYDEILDAKYRERINSLLVFLKHETTAKIWVTTRMHYKTTLENILSTFAIEFVSLDGNDKKKYITKYLKDRSDLVLDKNKFRELFINGKETQEHSLIQKYTTSFLDKMGNVFKENARFIGTPLQLHLMLNLNHFIRWIQNSEDQTPDFNYIGNNLLEIYQRFIERKYVICFKKMGIDKEQNPKEMYRFAFNMFNKDLAKSCILKSKRKAFLSQMQNAVLLPGILKSHGDDDIEFIHATFRDYFAAEVFFQWIKKEPNKLTNTNKQEFLLKEILMKPDYQLIRTFLDFMLDKTESAFLEENSKQYGEIIEKQLKERMAKLSSEKQTDNKTVLHIAVEEGNINVVCFLLNSVKRLKDVPQEFLLTPHFWGGTALHTACKRDDEKLVIKLLDFAAEISDDTLQKCLHAPTYIPERILAFMSNFHKKTTLCIMNPLKSAVSYSNNKIILEQLLTRANDKLSLILGENDISSLCEACFRGKMEFVLTLVQECQNDSNQDLLKQLLLSDIESVNALYCAIPYPSIVEYLLSVAKSINDNNETLKKLLLPGKNYAFNVLEVENIHVFKMLLSVVTYINDDVYTIKFLTCICNHKGMMNNLKIETEINQADVMKMLLEAVPITKIYMFQKITLKILKSACVKVHLDVENGHEDIFIDSLKVLEGDKYQIIRRKVIEMYNSTTLTDRLGFEKWTLIKAIRCNDIILVKKVLDYAKKSNTEELRILLLAVDDNGRITLHTACLYEDADLIELLISYAIDIDDEGKTLEELITSRNWANLTPFEVIKKKFSSEIDRIIRNLILKYERNKCVVNILKRNRKDI